MDPGTLFDRGPQAEAEKLPPRTGPRRLRYANRDQIEFRPCSLDQLISEEHEARVVWFYVCSCDLSELCERIQAVEGGPGQAPALSIIPVGFIPVGNGRCRGRKRCTGYRRIHRGRSAIFVARVGEGGNACR